jgi:hypothetical protein
LLFATVSLFVNTANAQTSSAALHHSMPEPDRATRRIEAHHAERAPKIDGVLDDEAWRDASVITTDATCGTEVPIPSLGLKRALPLNEPVDVEFTPQKAGDVDFVCGMGMLRRRSSFSEL